MPTAEINLSAISSNIALVRDYVGPDARIMPAIKADAYGHGAVQVAHGLIAAGIDWLAVATAGELLELREAGVGVNLFLLTPALERIPELAAADAVFGLHDFATLDRLLAADVPRGTRIHLKVDTGLSRVGTRPEQIASLGVQAERAGLTVEGVWTHFGSAEVDDELTREQLARLLDAVELLRLHGIEPPLRHAANSPGILNFPEAHLDMVRPGLLTYGYSPLPGAAPLPRAQPVLDGLRAALTLRAPVTQTKRVQAGTGISYHHLHRTSEATNIASIRLGYADGYKRLLSNLAWASVDGARLPVRGLVAMDQLLLETFESELQPGTQVTFLGGPGPGADELALLAGTNTYDILTSLGRRLNRRYVSD